MAEAEKNSAEQKPGLPMVIEAPRERPSLARNPTNATFVSHLLVAHYKVDAQTPRVNGALATYADGAKISTVRMPQGFRKTVIA